MIVYKNKEGLWKRREICEMERRGGEIRHRWRSRCAFNCRRPYGSREASVAQKDTSFLAAGVWYLGRGHEEEVRQTIRGERISSKPHVIIQVG